MSRLISFAVLIAIIIVIGLLFYKVLIGFFIPVFLAAVLVVVFRPLHRWVLAKTGHRDRLAAAMTTILIMLALFLPVTMVAIAATLQGIRLVEQNDAATLMLRVNKMRDSLGLELPEYVGRIKTIENEINKIVADSGAMTTSAEDENLKYIAARLIADLGRLEQAVKPEYSDRWQAEFDNIKAMASLVGQPNETEFGPSSLAVNLKSRFSELKTKLLGGAIFALARETANPTSEEVEEFTRSAFDYARPKLLSITGATGSFLIRLIFGSVILVVATFFFLYDGPGMVATIMLLSPLDDAYEQELLLEFDRISRAVVLATILSAIVQGLTAGLGYFMAGMNYLTLLIMLTTVFAMVPFVGPAVVWIPVCLYLALYEEHYWAAGLLAAWGVLVVGTVDNLVKAFVLHGQSQLHPLLALLSVLGGVQTLGPIGIVVGPMVVTMLQTLLSILQRELVHLEGQDLSLSSKKKTEPRARFKMREKPEVDQASGATAGDSQGAENSSSNSMNSAPNAPDSSDEGLDS